MRCAKSRIVSDVPGLMFADCNFRTDTHTHTQSVPIEMTPRPFVNIGLSSLQLAQSGGAHVQFALRTNSLWSLFEPCGNVVLRDEHTEKKKKRAL